MLFGFAWGSDAYEDDWIEEALTVDELRLRVQKLEDGGCGAIGKDDLFVSVKATGIQYTFCHENDLHIAGAVDAVSLTEEAARLRLLGWGIQDRIKPDKG